MVKMSHGPRAGSRMKMTKRVSERGMPPVTRFMQEFEVGDYASIDIEPSVHSGMPYHGFQGLTGRVVARQGDCYLVAVRVGGVTKKVLAAPVHLKKVVQ
ncbi:50S ribosomal protein L21e [Thermogymnomonas acidicola]|uniref:Large ribosomal subunit protein eL21 n=1 Tax=Thermogymnomonas acidicola TaxID=399579 RepID=A0AA37F8Y9_9ARCH|nr:50S ribosomal protein L21e [Thermogymnomonas acidicola]GGM69713.1 50S ribosomal protein L21e [Thermogymnomonas acidicola]